MDSFKKGFMIAESLQESKNNLGLPDKCITEYPMPFPVLFGERN